jgi:hypothetical protein
MKSEEVQLFRKVYETNICGTQALVTAGQEKKREY